MKVAIIGSGSWATALTKIISDNAPQNGAFLSWYIRKPETLEYLEKFHHNPNYLSSVSLPVSKIKLYVEISAIIEENDYLIFAIPSAFLHQTLKNINPEIFKNKFIISAIKGVIPETHQVLGDYFNTEWNIPFNNIAAIAGPCHAEEVALEKLSYLTIATENQTLAKKMESLLHNRFINITLCDDLRGAEFSSVLKNVYAIASGICHGLGYGDNFQAVLISGCLKEMGFLMDKIAPMNRNIAQHVYLGDLLVTAYSQFSRNRSFGTMIGKGYSVKSAQLEMNMIAEGYYATKSMFEIVKDLHIDMPILETVYRIIYEKKPASIEIRKLAELL